MDIPAPLGLSLAEVKNQRTTKCPQILGLKVTGYVTTIKKIRDVKLLLSSCRDLVKTKSIHKTNWPDVWLCCSIFLAWCELHPDSDNSYGTGL